MNLSNKTIVITGASSGIGEALAISLAKEKAKLILLARRLDVLRSIAKNIKKAQVIQCDVSDKSSVQKAFNQIQNIDILILNAGVSHDVSVKNFLSHKAEKTFGVNVMGMVYCLEQVLPKFLKKRKGTIVGMSSLADTRGFPGNAFYSSSKAAASSLLEGLRIELKKFSIKVITVRPGFVKTPLIHRVKNPPLLITPEKAAEKIIKGLKKDKKIIQFPLIPVIFMRLVGMLPRFLYDRIAIKFLK